MSDTRAICCFAVTRWRTERLEHGKRFRGYVCDECGARDRQPISAIKHHRRAYRTSSGRIKSSKNLRIAAIWRKIRAEAAKSRRKLYDAFDSGDLLSLVLALAGRKKAKVTA